MILWLLTGAAQQGGNSTTSPLGALIGTLFPFILLFAIMWLLIIRPQKKQQEAHRRMVAELKKGDRVVTAGGIIGEVTSIDGDEVRLRIADKVETRIIKSAVSRLLKG